ncbi:MAG TPA: hypothetical protein EYP28_06540 [Methanophagales archaeon]|nr:hypothetical protein [Methanophagales archaeon]
MEGSIIVIAMLLFAISIASAATFTGKSEVSGVGYVYETGDLQTHPGDFKLNRATALSHQGSGNYYIKQEISYRKYSVKVNEEMNLTYSAVNYTIGSSTLNLSSKWNANICNKNYKSVYKWKTAFSERYGYADHLEKDTYSYVSSSKSTLTIDSAVNGTAHIGAILKHKKSSVNIELSEDYVGNFTLNEELILVRKLRK